MMASSIGKLGSRPLGQTACSSRVSQAIGSQQRAHPPPAAGFWLRYSSTEFSLTASANGIACVPILLLCLVSPKCHMTVWYVKTALSGE